MDGISKGSVRAASSSSGERSVSKPNASRTAPAEPQVLSKLATHAHEDAARSGESKKSAMLTSWRASAVASASELDDARVT